MDTSPEYINMCKKATELQEMWEPKEGDYVYIKRVGDSSGHVKCIGFFNLNSGYLFYKDEEKVVIRENMDTVVWLPRDDQLIERSTLHWSDIIDYCGLEHSDYKLSFEIALLKIVMYKVFNKVWNVEDWI